MAKLRKKMLVQSKLEHCYVIRSYLELQISDLGMLYMNGKVRHRSLVFMRSPRFKNVVFKSKLQQQRKSLTLSCNPHNVQCSAHISSSRSSNDLNFFSWKDKTISYNFYEQLVPILMLAMTFCSNKKIRIFTKSRVGHPLNNQSSN